MLSYVTLAIEEFPKLAELATQHRDFGARRWYDAGPFGMDIDLRPSYRLGDDPLREGATSRC